ncbi:MAG: site-specific integrase [Actinobacteria bacterium]|nr:site-specific integrase [Actinomycetota bacterium]
MKRTSRQAPSGHVFRVERQRGPVWYAKYRLPDGRQVQKRLGPAWTGRGRPAAGYLTKRLAEDWLADTLGEARRGTLAGLVRTGATVADAAAEFLRYIEHDRARKPMTVKTYASIVRTHVLPAFGAMRLEDVTTDMVEEWLAETELAPRSRMKAVMVLQGIFKRATRLHGLPVDPIANVERPSLGSTGGIRVFDPDEIWQLVGAAASEQDAAIFLTAAFTGLRRGELIALRWRETDFARSLIRVRGSYSGGELTTPKSGKVRAVPMAPEVAERLLVLKERALFTGPEDLVFIGAAGDRLDGSALRRRYAAALTSAGLRQLRFHDLRHTFGTRMIAKADIRRVQEWMGHADIQTTMKYLHYEPREEDAKLVAEAFRVSGPRESDPPSVAVGA